MRKIYSAIIIILAMVFLLYAGSSLYNIAAISSYKCHDCNVLLITIDALRADHVSAYGYERNITPNIDSVAKDGILFRNAMGQASWTIPSLTSMLLSKNSPNSSIIAGYGVEGIPSIADALDSSLSTVAVIAYQSLHFLSRRFENFTQINVTESDVTSENVTSLAAGWIEGNKNKQFFLWVHYFDPHYTYYPPEGYRDLYPDYSGQLNRSRPYNISELRELIPNLTEDDIKYIVSLYDGEIKYTDLYIGVLLKKIKELGLDNKTVIIITADHGEEFLERGRIGHAETLYDEIIHVPLIIRNPRSPVAGVEIGNLVRLIDVGPTILDILGIKAPESFEGESIYKIVNGNIAVESFGRKYPVIAGDEDIFSLRTQAYKFVQHGDIQKGSELYNLSADPLERKNISAAYSDAVLGFRKAVAKYLTADIAERPDLSEEKKAVLRSLGYLT
jgi:arylsulfatase A-like enzyme